MMQDFYKNSENYSDPTAGEALSRVMARERKKKKPRVGVERFFNAPGKGRAKV